MKPFLAILIVVQFVSACRKHDPPVQPNRPDLSRTTPVMKGLPAGRDSVNGVFFASLTTVFHGSWTVPVTVSEMAAAFCDPQRILLPYVNHYHPLGTTVWLKGNVSAGALFENGDSLQQITGSDFDINYVQQSDTVVPHTLQPPDFVWEMTGNKSIAPSRFVIHAPFSTISDSLRDFTFVKGQNRLLDIPALVTEADSAAVYFTQPPSYYIFSNLPEISGLFAFAGTNQSFSIPHQQISYEWESEINSHLALTVVRYFHKWESGRLYIFVFCTTRIVPMRPLN